MVTIKTFRSLALSLEGTEELPHFEKTSFRIKKKIFATLDEKNNRACLMLSLIDQSVFSAFDKKIIYPVPNKWGQKGATFVELSLIPKPMLFDGLQQAYNNQLSKK
ncbi:MAG: MmcQ/YjbR family DNA-binding protein [Chitinophagales bacterium]